MCHSHSHWPPCATHIHTGLHVPLTNHWSDSVPPPLPPHAPPYPLTHNPTPLLPHALPPSPLTHIRPTGSSSHRLAPQPPSSIHHYLRPHPSPPIRPLSAHPTPLRPSHLNLTSRLLLLPVLTPFQPPFFPQLSSHTSLAPSPFPPPSFLTLSRPPPLSPNSPPSRSFPLPTLFPPRPHRILSEARSPNTPADRSSREVSEACVQLKHRILRASIALELVGAARPVHPARLAHDSRGAAATVAMPYIRQGEVVERLSPWQLAFYVDFFRRLFRIIKMFFYTLFSSSSFHSLSPALAGLALARCQLITIELQSVAGALKLVVLLRRVPEVVREGGVPRSRHQQRLLCRLLAVVAGRQSRQSQLDASGGDEKGTRRRSPRGARWEGQGERKREGRWEASRGKEVVETRGASVGGEARRRGEGRRGTGGRRWLADGQGSEGGGGSDVSSDGHAVMHVGARGGMAGPGVWADGVKRHTRRAGDRCWSQWEMRMYVTRPDRQLPPSMALRRRLSEYRRMHRRCTQIHDWHAFYSNP
ncbi:unnamed protein product [Closterium sp. NIES-64]|nr:unnamed protein product [Closterium sp. NIES-64]